MASTVYEQVDVGVSVAALVEQIKVTATVAVTVQVRPGDVSLTLDEFVHGAVADQFGCTTGFLRTHHLANESQLSHEVPTRGSERL
jgi:hypothetical protein